MPRVKRSVPARRRHKKILNLAKGFRMTHRTLFRPANEAVMHALEYPYRDRRARAGDTGKRWTARNNATPPRHGTPDNTATPGPPSGGVNHTPQNLAGPAGAGPPSLLR